MPRDNHGKARQSHGSTARPINPARFNGGWINVYGTAPNNPDTYLTQVYANLQRTEVEYIYPGLQFRLVAFASGLQMMSNGDQYDCIFENFEGLRPAITTL